MFNKLMCYLVLGFVISVGCAEAQSASSPDEIVAVDLLTVKQPRSQAEVRLRVIRLTTRSGATGYGDYLDFGLPAENEDSDAHSAENFPLCWKQLPLSFH